MRDPKIDPQNGDVLQYVNKLGITETYTVLGTKQHKAGAPLIVTYLGVHGEYSYRDFATLDTWRREIFVINATVIARKDP